MDKEYWLERWGSKSIGFNQAYPNALMQRYFDQLDLSLNATVLVPLCGKSIDMIWLASEGYNVVGVELSESACNDFFVENNLDYIREDAGDFSQFKSDNITLYAGDFFKLNKQLIANIDAVYDRAALIALPLEMRKRYCTFLFQLLPKQAQVLLLTTVYEQSQMLGPPFSVDDNEVHWLYGTYFDIDLLYQKDIRDIPAHLQAKGLIKAVEHVYHLSNLKRI